MATSLHGSPRRARVALVLVAVFLAAAGAAFAAGPKAPQPADDRPRCDLDTPLNVASFDTASGEALVALPGAAGGAYLVAWRPGDTAVRVVRTPADGPWFGGSVGPGAPFVFERCGDGCLQPVALREGAWKSVGEPIALPSAATVAGTYDRSGRPWVVVHGAGTDGRPGFVTAWAFRLEGTEWRSRGRLQVTAFGTPAALPAPWRDDAVVSGTGLFAARGGPTTWIAGLPAGGHEAGTQLAPLSERRVAFLSADGVAFQSLDAGATWSRATWRPWETGTAEPWTRGKDFSVDRPLAGSLDLLPLVWFDRRLAGHEALLLTEMNAAGRWRQVASGAARVPTTAGEDLEVSSVLLDAQGRWTVLFGCVRSGGAPSLVLSELAGDRLGAPRLVPLGR